MATPYNSPLVEGLSQGLEDMPPPKARLYHRSRKYSGDIPDDDSEYGTSTVRTITGSRSSIQSSPPVRRRRRGRSRPRTPTDTLSPSTSDPQLSMASPVPMKPQTNQLSESDQKQMEQLQKEQLKNKEKETVIRTTFTNLSSILIVLFTATLVYFDCQMLLPHFNSIFWAALWSIFLIKPRQWLLDFFDLCDMFIGPYKLYIYSGSIAGIVGLCWWSSHVAVIISWLAIGVLWTLFIFGNKVTVTNALLVVATVFVIVFPFFFFVKTCAEEGKEIADRVAEFVKKNKDFKEVLNDFAHSPTFLWMQDYAQSWGYNIEYNLDTITNYLAESVTMLGGYFTTIVGSVLNLVVSGGKIVVSVVTFISCLFYFLENQDGFIEVIHNLSPFPQEDNEQIKQTIKDSVYKIFTCSFIIGVLHGLTTYFTFSIAGIDKCQILSFVSGFMAMLPVFSSWIVWFPACIGLFVVGQRFHALFVAVVQLFLYLFIDQFIYATIPGHTYLIGMSIVMGIYVFGSIGVLFGPLLTGLSGALLNIYMKYYTKPFQKQQSPPSRSSRRSMRGSSNFFSPIIRKAPKSRTKSFMQLAYNNFSQLLSPSDVADDAPPPPSSTKEE